MTQDWRQIVLLITLHKLQILLLRYQKQKTMCSWSSVDLVAQILQSFSMKLSTRKAVGCLCLSSGFSSSSLWSCMSKENSNEQPIMFTKLPWAAHYVHKIPMSSSLCSQNSHEQLIIFTKLPWTADYVYKEQQLIMFTELPCAGHDVHRKVID